MESPGSPRILWAERMENAVIIGFDNGRSAVYSSRLLHAIFAQAQEITDLEPEFSETP
jgi:hypothetical protein